MTDSMIVVIAQRERPYAMAIQGSFQLSAQKIAETHCITRVHLFCAGFGRTCIWHSFLMMQFRRVDIQALQLTQDSWWLLKAHTRMILLGI